MSSLDILQAFIPLILIVVLLYGVLFYIKRKGFRLRPIATSKHGIEVISTQPIMPKKYLSLIKVKDKVLVVGMTENSITLLKEIEYDESFTGNEKNKNESFGELLKKNLGMN